MEFKIQSTTHAYQVATANEANEEERRRQRQETPARPSDKKMTEAGAAPSSTEAKETNSEPIESQIIDSKTTLELLSHRPVNSKSLHERLRKLTKASAKENLVSDVKHFNKTL